MCAALAHSEFLYFGFTDDTRHVVCGSGAADIQQPGRAMARVRDRGGCRHDAGDPAACTLGDRDRHRAA